MKKYLITTCLLLSIYLPTFSQSTMYVALRLKRDALKSIMPSLKGSAKVDCLNAIVDIYQILDEDNQMQIDSASPYATLAFDGAKKIGYKRGMGYACLKMAYIGILKAIVNDDDIIKAPGFIDKIENQINQAKQIGGELNDDAMTGSAYSMVSWLEQIHGTKEKRVDFIRKAITYFEKIRANQAPGIYKEMSFTDCNSCTGYEMRLGWLYGELGSLEKDVTVTINDYKKAISYFEKAGAKSSIGGAYRNLGDHVCQRNNLEEGIEYIKKGIAYYQEDGNEIGELRSYERLCAAYWNLGDFENGLNYTKKCVTLAEKLVKGNATGVESDDIKNNHGNAYYWMGRFYSIAGDYETALAFIKKGRNYYSNEWWRNVSDAAIGENYRLMGNYDSSMYYLAPFAKKPGGGLGKTYISSLYIDRKQYDKALPFITEMVEIESKNNANLNLSYLYTIAAQAYLGLNDYSSALRNARAGLALMKKTKRNVKLIENYQVLSEIFNKMGNTDSAYIYLKRYTVLKDSLLNRQFLIRLNDYKKEAEDAKKIGQIKLLQKDNQIKEQNLLKQILLQQKRETELVLLDQGNEIKDKQLLIKDQSLKEQTLLKEQNQSQLTLLDKENKLKDQQLKQQAFIKNALLGGLLLFILLGVFVFRTLSLKRKNEKLAIGKTQAELFQKMSELEMQALRAQMNPHFIFNCLSSINRFILKNEVKDASNYLTRFSRLMRMVLNNSQKPLIALDDELEMLGLYLEMERLRFKNSFDYGITFLNTVDSDNVFIPPLLLQPFCENAIWHGLMHLPAVRHGKERQGRLDIALSMEDNILNCTVTDNGVGREKAEELKSKTAEKEKSLGLKITTERLSLLNHEKGLHTFYDIEDLQDENGNAVGTKVTLKISFKEAMEEAV